MLSSFYALIIRLYQILLKCGHTEHSEVSHNFLGLFGNASE